MLLALREDVRDGTLDDGTAVLTRGGALAVAPAEGTPEARAFSRLRASPASAGDLEEIAGRDGSIGAARWLLWSERALARGVLLHRVNGPEGRMLAEFVPVRPGAPDLTGLDPSIAAAGSRMALSRFAMLRRRGDVLVLESPLTAVRVQLSAAGAALVTSVDGTRTLEEIADAEADPDAARLVLAAVQVCGFLVERDDEGRSAEDEERALAQWEAHDLVLHARTRTSRVDDPRGGTFRFLERWSSPPAMRHPVGRPDIPLPVPDLDRLVIEDAPFARVMEERTSRREFGPTDAAMLGEFLYRTVRVRRQIPGRDGSRIYPRTDRPHPAAGGMYELITYLAVSECDGIPPGLYRYDPVAHGLELVAASGPAVDRLLDDARSAAVAEARPPVLVILAADFARLSWKYEGIAYAATLKDVGVLFATMQLAATAMGLGSCPLGGGDSDAFAAATGLDPLEEGSVGELMLGS